jgi:hypothetical protein
MTEPVSVVPDVGGLGTSFDPADYQDEPRAPKPRRPRKDKGAESLAFWQALVDAARVKYAKGPK